MKLLIAVAAARLTILGIIIYAFYLAFGFWLGLGIYFVISILWTIADLLTFELSAAGSVRDYMLSSEESDRG